MRLSDFDFDLPDSLIAQQPPAKRGDSRLMIIDRRAGTIRHAHFSEFPGLLRPGDLLILNDTRVLPARLHGRRQSGAAIEVLLTAERAPGQWRVLMTKAGRVHAGEILILENGALRATARERLPDGSWVLAFDTPDLRAALQAVGRAPLPPYIRREAEDVGRAADRERYQTVFAARDGAIAAPTAGLHFTAGMLDAIRAAGIRTATVTLHVGEGTFKPVTVDDPREHVMHAEWYELPADTAAAVHATRQHRGRVFAVGTTTVRTLETAARSAAAPEIVQAGAGESRLFIYPPYEFRAVDAMLTNFHLPKSTLLMLVSAFAGVELIRRAYAEAVARGYRFFSYGDCMAIV